MRSPPPASVLCHARRAFEPALDLGDDHLDGDGVLSAARHDDVGVALAGLHELQVHRLHRRQVLVEDLLQRPAAFGHVAPDPPHQPDVRVGIDKHLHVAQRPNALVDEQQDPVDHDHVRRRDALGARTPRVRHEVVHRLLDRLAARQVLEVRDEQVEIERVRMVPVDLPPLVHREMGEVAVVPVHVEEGDRRIGTDERVRSAIFRATVDLPEPVPPAMPMISGFTRTSPEGSDRRGRCDGSVTNKSLVAVTLLYRANGQMADGGWRMADRRLIASSDEARRCTSYSQSRLSPARGLP